MNNKIYREVDLDLTYKFGEIKCLMHHEGKFYVLANKMNNQLGYYLLELNQELHGDVEVDDCKFVIKWTNKLQIGDGSIDFIADHCHSSHHHGTQFVIAFKTIRQNTYTVI